MKGGVGKTTVATLLGLVLAESRGDRVIALDANPDAGTLADRLTGESAVTVRELVRDLERIDSWAAVSHYTSLVGPAAGARVRTGRRRPVTASAATSTTASAPCWSATSTSSSPTRAPGSCIRRWPGSLARAQSLVIVGAPTVDGAGRASKTLDWLWSNGFALLATDAVAVLSSARSSADVDSTRIREHFAARCRAVVEIPHDPQLAVGGRVELARLAPATRDAAFELAALVADDFAS